MSEQSNLEQLVERDRMYSGADALGKDLRSEEVDKRGKAREIVKAYLVENGVVIPEDQPVPDEVYDNGVIAMKAESGRDNYWNKQKEKCVSELPSGILEEKVLGIKPIKLKEGQRNSKKHNEAYKLHEAFLELGKLNHDYDKNEIRENELYEVALGESANYVRERLEGDEYLNTEDKALVLRAAASALRVPSVARATTGRMQMQKEFEFSKYFEKAGEYSKSDYAGENLIYNKNIDEAIGQVEGLYAESMQESPKLRLAA